jgi:hypothetical protein
MNKLIIKNKFYWNWLMIVVVFIGVFGLSTTIFPDIIRKFFGWMVYNDIFAINNLSDIPKNYISLSHAVFGSVMFGWSISMIFNLMTTFRDYTKQSFFAFLIPVLCWFMPDTAYSLASGFWQNAVFNLVFLLMLGIPLLAIYRSINDNI